MHTPTFVYMIAKFWNARSDVAASGNGFASFHIIDFECDKSLDYAELSDQLQTMLVNGLVSTVEGWPGFWKFPPKTPLSN